MDIKGFLNTTLLPLGEYDLKVSTVLKLAFLAVIVVLFLFGIRKAIFKAHRIEHSRKYSIYILIKYFILVLAIVIALQILNFNLSVLLASSAALLVGIGLGIQNLFSDFVSGIILLVDSSVKVDDVIDIGGLVCQVQEINLRTTTVLTRDDKYIIIPNTDLTKNRLINWTHSNVASRFEIAVGVDYSSDVHQVMNILKEVAVQHEGVLAHPDPFVRFTDYGASSLSFSVYFWVENVFRVENIKSEIRVKIFDEFKKAGIQIPFPQRVVHIKKSESEN